MQVTNYTVTAGCAAVWRRTLVIVARLSLLLASLTGMATTIVAEEGARCGVVGTMKLAAG
jgi:hypothetical protein